jgi:3-hydroxyisobutyrate dehydrogenase-like beta-hydroxyacid dehydrogenase
MAARSTKGNAMSRQRIGFVGVGLMGSSMARHLMEAGFPVIVHDTDAACVAAAVKLGAKTVTSPDQMPGQVDVLIFSLPTSDIVKDVVHNQLRLFETGRPDLIVLDATTADPEKSAALAMELAKAGIRFLDCTVSGTSEMCAVKDIIFMVGGNQEAYAKCEPLFAAMGREWMHMGASGNGAIMKLCVNLVLGLNRMALAEGLTLARKAGIDPLQALEVLKKSAAFSKIMDQKGYRMVEKRFHPPAGKLRIYLKDVRAMLALGERLNCPLPLIGLHAQALASEVSKGRGEWDSADIISFYDELAGYPAPKAPPP